MSATENKLRIKEAIEAFASQDVTTCGMDLFRTLGYRTDVRLPMQQRSYDEFAELFAQGSKQIDTAKAFTDRWASVDMLFQLTADQLSAQDNLFKNETVDHTIIESYLFFAIELKAKKKDQLWTRTDLSHITREVNKLFAMPVMLLFKHGDTLTLSIIDRRLHKRESSKDVLEKVTLIKDIRTASPHRAHIEILFDLSLEELQRKKGFTSFPALHAAWRATLDTKELNKRFFRELSNWYFHAVEVTRWPDDNEKDADKRNATNTIRLITRLMFVWFLREKNLVPDALFDPRELKKILKPDAKGQSNYYKAILQNLFFATLNTEMGKRRFRAEPDKSQSRHFFIHNVFRYEHCFVDPKETLTKLFEPIPFLNGGLFECLDRQTEVRDKLKPIRIDGFSDRDDNPLHVPDKLFFDPVGEEMDFSAVYGSKKARKEKVRGLVDILGSYKFTITENTPIEEEVALDPELLGKVFENLLANFNPETKTTARKQTGSFYTPREIVNYMVDESLIAYLRTALSGSNDKKADDGLEVKLRQLLSYSEEPQPFSKKETEQLIAAIDTCKILDPACGSGAFPMGVLHKLVHVLHKLDPQNKQWKERQVEKASALDDADIRERAIEDIEDAFANNALDYGRKLYLIENGIYGVDIQPIAMQIAKLRFFISLVVDQQVQAKRDNLGVRPLPNLETKFVAANTLMKLKREEANLFTNPQIEEKKVRLKRVRHDYFEARTPKRKAKCREQDKQLRGELAELLMQEHELQPKEAKMLAAWDPYDQNASAPFFDPEWMFGLGEGFDIVIGNPPWGGDLSGEEKQQLKSLYPEIDSSTPNTFAYFIGHGLLHYKSYLSFVLPDSILVKDFAKTRRLIASRMERLDWYENAGLREDIRPFVYVDHDVCVLCLGPEDQTTFTSTIWAYDSGVDNVRPDIRSLNKAEVILDEFDYVVNLIAREADFAILHKIHMHPALSASMQCHEGVHTGNMREVLFTRDSKGKHKKKLFYGASAGDDIQDYSSHWSGWYVNYDAALVDKEKGLYASLRDKRIFDHPKLYVTRTGNPFKVFHDETTYASNNFFSLQFKDYKDNSSAKLKLTLAFVQSPLLNYFVRTFACPRIGSTFIETKILHLLKYHAPFDVSAKVKSQLEKLVEQRLGLEAGAAAEALEREIDQVVYGLYGLTAAEIAVVEGSGKKKIK